MARRVPPTLTEMLWDGLVTIMKGDRNATDIMIDLEDNDGAEFTEQLGIRLTSASGATGVTFDDAVTNVMILDTDPTEYTLVGAATVIEGNAYTVQLSRKSDLSLGRRRSPTQSAMPLPATMWTLMTLVGHSRPVTLCLAETTP